MFPKTFNIFANCVLNVSLVASTLINPAATNSGKACEKPFIKCL